MSDLEKGLVAMGNVDSQQKDCHSFSSGLCVYDVIIKPLMTEKSLLISREGKFCFFVDFRSSKKDISASLDIIYPGAKVDSVNVISVPSKRKRFKGKFGKVKRMKKALVKFKNPSLVEINSL